MNLLVTDMHYSITQMGTTFNALGAMPSGQTERTCTGTGVYSIICCGMIVIDLFNSLQQQTSLWNSINLLL